MSSPERQHPRFAADIAVLFYVGTQVAGGRTRNVSRGGMCAMLFDALPVGADVELDMVLVFDDASQSEPLRLPARVVWCTPLEDGHQVGVAFRGLGREQAEYLTMFLRFLGGEKPTKQPRPTTVDDRFG